MAAPLPYQAALNALNQARQAAEDAFDNALDAAVETCAEAAANNEDADEAVAAMRAATARARQIRRCGARRSSESFRGRNTSGSRRVNTNWDISGP